MKKEINARETSRAAFFGKKEAITIKKVLIIFVL